MKNKKFRELQLDIFSIHFDNIKIKRIVNYMPAGNDVVEVLDDNNNYYFVKIERSKVTDFDAEYRNVNNLKNIGYSLVPNIVEYKTIFNIKCLVLKKINGKRLNVIINNSNKKRYLYKLGKELSYIHSIKMDNISLAKQRVINDIPNDEKYELNFNEKQKTILSNYI